MSNTIDDILQRLSNGDLGKDSPTPLYFQIFSLLQRLILNGTIAHLEQLPTEAQLTEALNVSRITAKRAMDELAKKKLIERHRGKGSYVAYQYSPKPVQAPLVGMLQEIESMARNSTATVLECSCITPPHSIRAELLLEDNEKALHLIRVRQREGLKFGYYVSWTTGVKLPESPNLFETEPRLSYFRKNGLEITHVTQTLSAVNAEQEIADALGVTAGAALLKLTRRSYNKSGDSEQLRDHLTVFYNPEHFQYEMDLKID